MGAADNWRFVAVYFDLDGAELGTEGLRPDFGPAYESCQLAGVSAGTLSSTATLPPGSVVPVWAGETGAPRVEFLRVGMDADRGGSRMTIDLDVSLFLRAEVRRGAARLVARGAIEEGQLYRHHVLAFPVAAVPAGAAAVSEAFGDLDVDVENDTIAIVSRSMPAALAAEIEADTCPVFVQEEVERDLVRLATLAGDYECGAGILGYLARDPASGRLFVELTAVAPVRGGRSEKSSFVFTDESWASIHEIAALRGAGELLCGYAHSHPNFCARCAPEKRERCAFARPFFSEEDVHLQRACFPKAWQVALLASDVPDRGRVVTLYGWRAGVVAERRYVTVPAAPAVDVPAARDGIVQSNAASYAAAAE